MAITRQSLSLYLVTDPFLCAQTGLVETVTAALKGGVSFVQIRDKQATTQQLISIALQVKQVIAGSHIPLVINDNVEAAIASEVDGVHIGQEDMDAAEVRELIGPERILGLSVETEATALNLDPAIIDYAGAGPVFATQTKRDHKMPIGFTGLKRLCSCLTVPVVAIGGLKEEHCTAALAAGADGVAVVSAICGQPDPEQAARNLLASLERAEGEL